MPTLSRKFRERELTNLDCHHARYNPTPDKAKGETNRLAHRNGLALELLPTGAKRWSWKYRYLGNEREIIFGKYPAMPLKGAEEALDAGLALLAQDPPVDPAAVRRAEKLALTQGGQSFEDVARKWFGKQTKAWQAEKFARDLMRRFEQRVFPVFGSRHVKDITPQDCVRVCEVLEAEDKVSTAHKLRRALREVFNFAIAHGHISMNPPASIQAALAKTEPVEHRRRVESLPLLGAMMRATEVADTQPIFKLALRFLALTVARADMVRLMTWDELHDLDSNCPTWIVPGHRMKNRRNGVGKSWTTPLCGAALDILRAVAPLRAEGGSGRYVFPSWHAGAGDKPLSKYCFQQCLQQARQADGTPWLDRHCAHGFRGAFKTFMIQRPGRLAMDREAIEAQMQHAKEGEVAAAYDDSEFLERRVELCAEWAGLILAGAPDAQALLFGTEAPSTFLEAAE